MKYVKKGYLGGVLSVILFLIAFVSAYAIVGNSSMFHHETVQPTPVTEPDPVEEGSLPQYAPIDREDSVYTALLAGYGGAGHDGGALTDSIILVEVDPDSKKALIVSIPRDLWVIIPTDYNNTAYHKINAAYAIGLDNVKYPNKRPEFKGASGAGNLIKSVVSQIIGVKVDYCATVNFDGFVSIINTLGNIEVNVPKAFDDYFFPIKGLENETCGIGAKEITDLHSKYAGFELEKQFTCRYEHLHFDQGLTTIDGELALKFVRSRHGDSDFGRSERQFAVLEAISNKLISLNAFSNAGKLLDTLSGMVKTDLSVKKMVEIYQVLGEGKGYAITRIHLSEDNTLVAKKGPQGQYILIPKAGINNYTEIQNIIGKSMSGDN